MSMNILLDVIPKKYTSQYEELKQFDIILPNNTTKAELTLSDFFSKTDKYGDELDPIIFEIEHEVKLSSILELFHNAFLYSYDTKELGLLDGVSLRTLDNGLLGFSISGNNPFVSQSKSVAVKRSLFDIDGNIGIALSIPLADEATVFPFNLTSELSKLSVKSYFKPDEATFVLSGSNLRLSTGALLEVFNAYSLIAHSAETELEVSVVGVKSSSALSSCSIDSVLIRSMITAEDSVVLSAGELELDTYYGLLRYDYSLLYWLDDLTLGSMDKEIIDEL